MSTNWNQSDVDEYNCQLAKIKAYYPGLADETCEKFAAEIVDRLKAKKKD